MAFTPRAGAVINFVVEGAAEAQRRIESMGGAFNELGGVAKTSLGQLAAFAGVGLSLGALAAQVLGAQREFDKLNASLVTATGSTGSAAQAFQALQAFATATPYSVQEATEAFITLRNLGLTPSEKALRSYGNTAAAMGKDLDQMIEAVADAATGEFERLKEFGIKASQNGEKVSLTFKGVTKTIDNESKDIQEYLQNIGEVDFAGAMERRANTLDGAISGLADTWDSALLRISKIGLGDAMASTVSGVSAALTDLGAILDVVGGKAKDESKAIKEATGVHAILTTTFEALAVLGANVAFIFQAIGGDIGAFAAQVKVLFEGGVKGLLDGSTKQAVQDIGRARVAEAEAERKAVDEKSAAIVGAADRAREAQAKEAEERKESGKDRLAQYAVELSADEKRAQAKQAILEIENRLNGVNAQATGELKKLTAALEAGAISQAQYNKYAAQINEDARKSSSVYKDQVKALDMSADAIKRRSEAMAFANAQEREHLEFLRRTGQMNEEDFIGKSADNDVQALSDQKKALQDQLDLAKRKIDSQKEQKALIGQIDMVEKQIGARRTKEENELFALEQQRYRAAADNYADQLEAAQAQTKAQQDAVRDQQDEISMLGMTAEQIAAVTAQRLRDQAAMLEQRAITLDLADATRQLGDENRKQAAALRAQADNTVVKEEATRQKEIWTSIENTAHDTFISIFDSGKSAFDRLRDALKNGLLDLLYQMTLKKWIINIGASVGLGGSAGLAQAGTGAAGASSGAAGMNSAISAVQTASGIYKAITGGLNSIGPSVADAVQATLYKAGLTSNIASNGAVAQFAGAASSMASGYMLGSGLNSMISGQYQVGSGFQTVEKIGTAVASYFGPVAGAITGAVSGLINRAFGMGDKKVTAQGVRGTLTASGLDGENYATWHQDGGWFRSDKNGTDTSALSADMVKQFTEGLTAIEKASAGFASSLGVQSDWIKDYSKTFDLKLTGDQTKDAQTITDFFAGIGDDIAKRLVPNLEQLSKSGETASAALERLAGDFQGTDQVAQLLGVSAEKLFGSAGLQSTAAREQLIDMAGGLSVLSQQAAFFNQNFLTDAERIKPVAEALDKALASLGLSTIPTTRDEFKNLVNGLIASGAAATESGAKQLDSLLALGEAFAQVHPAMQDAAAALAEVNKGYQDQIDELVKASLPAAQVREMEIAGMDASTVALYDRLAALKQEAADTEKRAQTEASLLELKAQIYELTGDKAGAAAVLEQQHAAALAALDPALRGATQQLWDLQAAADSAAKSAAAVSTDASTLLGGVDNAFAALQRVVAREKEAVQSSIDAHTASVSKLQSLSQSLHSTLDSMQSPDQQLAARAMGQAQIRAALAIARAGGVLPDADALKDALAVVKQDASSQFGSYQDYLRDLYQTQNDIGQLGDLTDASLTVEQQALEAAQKQLEALDGVLAGAQEQIDVLKGQSISLLSIDQAIQALGTAIASAQANPVVGATGSIADAYQSYLHRAPDAVGLQFWQNQIAAGVPLPSIIDAIRNSNEAKGIPGFAAGGMFGGGLRLVGENGPELEVTGPSRIWSSSQTAALLSRASSGSNDALVAEIKALREEVTQLREANSAENRAIARGAQQAGDVLDKWDASGQPKERIA